MNPPVVEPASPVVAPREDPSIVEAPPAVPLAANPADVGDRATAAGRLATAPPGSASSRLDPHQRRPVPLCPPPRVPILARLAARVVRAAARKVKRVGPASGASPKRRKSSTAAAPSSEAGAPASATCTPRPSARADF
ncbi:hypothetical protein PF005_g16077, partial [Phytophthora fragariae]